MICKEDPETEISKKKKKRKKKKILMMMKMKKKRKRMKRKKNQNPHHPIPRGHLQDHRRHLTPSLRRRRRVMETLFHISCMKTRKRKK